MTTSPPVAHTVERADATIGALTALGVLIVLAALGALIYAGVSVADEFPPTGDTARDTGVFRAVTAWGTPLALLGVATLFAAAIPVSLARIRAGIEARRDALTAALPQLLRHH